MPKEVICGIYCIENIVNSKKYVGQSVNIHRRFLQHKSKLRRNLHGNQYLQNAWNKYGENSFKFSVLEKCEIASLDQLEVTYIKQMSSVDRGYNIGLGGHVNRIISDETKKKLSIVRKNPSEDVRDRMGRGHRNRKPILQIDLHGSVIREWHSAREASRKLKIEFSCVWNCLNAKRRTYRDFIWIYKSDEDNFRLENYINQQTQSKKINQFSKDGSFIKQHISANSSLKDGFDPSSVLKNCKGKLHTHKGFVFKFAS